MHIELAKVDIDSVSRAESLSTTSFFKFLMWVFVIAGIAAFGIGLFSEHHVGHVWGVYYVNVIFFMGLAAGSCMLPVIFQITRAAWSGPIRRIAEVNVAFLPVAYCLFLITYYGKEHLFPWAIGDMPGREWWMQADFAYARFAVIFAILFYCQWRFIKPSFRQDFGVIKERGLRTNYTGWFFDWVSKNWKGSDKEIRKINTNLSVFGPVVVFIYATVYTMFGFEMIKGMDTHYVSNLFGAFMFVGNILIAWAVCSIRTTYHAFQNKDFGKTILTQQFWDLGKLTLGFCMLWGYFFLSQFLPQWYGNLPEETQWLILRTREFPWKGLGWFTLSITFICPFILLISEDIKKNPITLSIVSCLPIIGVWCEHYIEVIPQVYPTEIPFNGFDILITLGFFGAYMLVVQGFLKSVPFTAVGHPLTHGKRDW